MRSDRSATAALRAVLIPSLVIGLGSPLAATPGIDATCFGSGFTPTFQSGDGVPSVGSFVVSLQPQAGIIYLVQLETDSRGRNGGMVTFEALSEGQYGIRLSAAARVVVVQDHLVTARLRFETSFDCVDASFASEFESAGGPVTLQIADVVATRLSVVVWRR